MAHAHDVDSGNTLSNVGVYAFEIPQNSFFPIVPIALQQHLSVLRWRSVSQGPIKRPYSAVNMGAQTLMGRVNISKSWRIQENIVPCRVAAIGIRQPLEGEICS